MGARAFGAIWARWTRRAEGAAARRTAPPEYALGSRQPIRLSRRDRAGPDKCAQGRTRLSQC